MLLIPSVLAPDSLTVGSFNVVGTVGFLVLLLALGTGATAIIGNRERSWTVWLSTGLPVIVLGFEIVSWLSPVG